MLILLARLMMPSRRAHAMDLHTLKIFLAVAQEKSFSRAAEKVFRTQPAVSLAVQRLERELGEPLVDRNGKHLLLTDTGRVVCDYARRLANLTGELDNALVELRDRKAGRLVIGANESTSLYLLEPLSEFRRRYPRIKIQVRRSLSSRIPGQLVDGDLELGVVSYDPGDPRLVATVIHNDRLAFVVGPKHRLAGREQVAITELGLETFIAHNVLSPYRETVLKVFQRHRVPLNMEVEMPTVETIRKLVERGEGVAFLPKMCVESEIRADRLREVRVNELSVERKIRLLHPSDRTLSHAARAFLEVAALPVPARTLSRKGSGRSKAARAVA